MIAIWRSERGSTALTLIWFMLLALLLAIGLDSFMGIYIARQQGQSAADAAALMVTRAISARLPDEVWEEAGRRVHLIIDDSRERIAAYVDELRAEQELCAATPLCVPLTAEELAERVHSRRISEYRNAFARRYPGSLPRSMAERIADGTWSDAPSVRLRDELIPDDDDFGCLIVATARKHRAAILSEADDLATLNRGSLDWSRTELARARGEHLVVVLRTIHPFGAEWIFEDGALPKLHIQVVAELSSVGDRTPHYPEHC